jgi:hypothetical protein
MDGLGRHRLTAPAPERREGKPQADGEPHGETSLVRAVIMFGSLQS